MQPLVEVGATFAETTAVNNREQSAHTLLCFCRARFLDTVVFKKARKGSMVFPMPNITLAVCDNAGQENKHTDSELLLIYNKMTKLKLQQNHVVGCGNERFHRL